MLLSQFSDKDVLERLGRKPLPARTPRTLTKPNEIVAEIRSVREKGYAISDEELEVGLRSLAVPVAGSTGEIIAAKSNDSLFGPQVAHDGPQGGCLAGAVAPNEANKFAGGDLKGHVAEDFAVLNLDVEILDLKHGLALSEAGCAGGAGVVVGQDI